MIRAEPLNVRNQVYKQLNRHCPSTNHELHRSIVLSWQKSNWKWNQSIQSKFHRYIYTRTQNKDGCTSGGEKMLDCNFNLDVWLLLNACMRGCVSSALNRGSKRKRCLRAQGHINNKPHNWNWVIKSDVFDFWAG